MNLLAPVNRDSSPRPIDPSAPTRDIAGGEAGSIQLDPASLLGLFAHIHALGLAQLASSGNSTGQAPVPSQALRGGLLALLPAAPASPLLQNADSGIGDTTRPTSIDPGRIEDRARQRYVSGVADQVNGGESRPEPQLLARGVTNCDNAFSFCLARLPDLRSRAKCDRLKALCENGVPGIFGPGVGGSRMVE